MSMPIFSCYLKVTHCSLSPDPKHTNTLREMAKILAVSPFNDAGFF
jgi:hypothetical protein